MEFGVLGPLEVVRDGQPVALGSYRQRSLLALLLVHANTVVSTDQLLDELWGDAVAADRQNALWVHVSNLRSALEPDRPRRSEGTVLLTRPPGYLVQVQPEDLDAWRFESLLREGRTLLDHDPAAASVAVGEALALWRGRAYEEFAYESFAGAEIARLEELRLEAVEIRLDADLRRGLSSELVGELEGLVRLHPLRERLTALLMLALHRSGRRSEALRAFRRLRTHLGEELGIDPSDELGRLETRILAGDPSLDAGLAGSHRPTRLAVRGYELREPISTAGLGTTYRAYQPTVGREVAVRVVGGELADDPDFIRRFEAQAELIARLEHPHIVPLYDYWREPGAAYVVTRLLRGGTLADRIEAGPLDEPAAARVAGDIGAALAFAHHHGLVHGAVGPGTILLDDEGHAYLADFAVPADDDTPASDIGGLAAAIGAALAGGGRQGSPKDGAALLDRLAGGLHPAGPGPADTDIENPYKGLQPFEESDADDFFGRERTVERLLVRLGGRGASGRLVVLVGPSGSGKSSIVRAGVLPALRRGAVTGSADWFIVDLTPGAQPFEALAAALRRIAVDPPADLADALASDPAGLRRTVEQVLPDPQAQVLVVIDQFEELFTMAPPDVARRFLDALADGVSAASSRVRVLATLRGDFYDRPLAHRGFGELLRRGTEVVTPMSPEELGRAIDGPAERVGVRFERAVMAEIVAEVADRPGALPLLQFALRELVERRHGAVVDLTSYQATGGVAGALVRRAEALYEGLDREHREVTRQVLLRLVSIGEDAAPVARRRVLRRDLAALGEPAVDTVLERFGRHRLLSFDRDPATRGPTVEVAHEALLTEWGRLQGWIEDGRDDVRQHRRLAARVEEWLAAGRDDGYLLHGPQLDVLAAWAERTDLALTPVEVAFLTAGQDRRHRERAAEAGRRSEEARLRRTARSRARLSVGVVAVAALVATMAGFAVAQRDEAERLASEQAAVADGRRLATTAAVTAADDPELAMLLALQSLELSLEAGIPALPEAEEALHWALQAARVPYPVADAPVEVRVGPNGSTGIFRLALPALVGLVRANLDRTLTAGECARFAIERCPTDGRGLASPASDGNRPVPDAEPTSSSAAPTGDLLAPLSGTTITVAGGLDLNGPLRALFDRFEGVTGIEVVYRTAEWETFWGLDFSAAPLGGSDLVLLTAPLVREAAEDGLLLDLAPFVAAEDAEEAWGSHLASIGTVGASRFGVPFRLVPKGLVWYPAAQFEAAGYAVPETWADLQVLTARMAAGGGTPWCMGLNSTGEGGWPASDWVEGFVLRTGGIDLYDRWVAHEIPFDHADIVRAAQLFGDLVFDAALIGGTTDDALARSFFTAGQPMLQRPPGCWLTFAPSFLPYSVQGGAGSAADLGFFVLPPLEAGGPPPMFGQVELLGALTDRPEVRQLIRMMMHPDRGPAWAAAGGFPYVPAHLGSDARDCDAESLDDRWDDLWVELCSLTLGALARGEFRVDASELMPDEIGDSRGGLRPLGRFLVAMDNYVRGGPATLAGALASVEAAWPDP